MVNTIWTEESDAVLIRPIDKNLWSTGSFTIPTKYYDYFDIPRSSISSADCDISVSYMGKTYAAQLKSTYSYCHTRYLFRLQSVGELYSAIKNFSLGQALEHKLRIEQHNGEYALELMQ